MCPALCGRLDMLKRPFQAVSSSSWLPDQSTVSGMAVGYPRPIDQRDKQRLVKLSDSQDKVCVSGWSSQDLPAALGAHRNAPIKRQFFGGTVALSPQANAPSPAETRIRQLNQYVQQQQRLRQVERQLRQSLDLDSILGTAVVEIAALFGAMHVSLLRYSAQAQAFEQVARYCDRESRAWQPPLTLSLATFPQFCRQLLQGKALHVVANSSHASQLRLTESPLVESPLVESSLVASSLEVWNVGQPIGQPSVRQAEALDNDQESSHKASSQKDRQTTGTGDVEADPSKSGVSKEIDQESRQWLAQQPGRWLTVPVKYDVSPGALFEQEQTERGQIDVDNCWGVMALALPNQAVWSIGAIAAVESLSTELTLAMTQSRQYQELLTANQELQKLALSDGLTSLANRRRFDKHLSDEWHRLARDRRPLSLILCDLDHFKRYNDTFGHPAGDRCLIRVARALLSGPQRPADLVARYGGEEFAIILPNTDTHGAWRIAQKIHESIRELQIPHAQDNEEPYVTVTMGVSTVIPGHDNTPQMLLQASDLALYYAKQQGRNRTYVNGHYNTVKTAQTVKTPLADATEPDIVPLSSSE